MEMSFIDMSAKDFINHIIKFKNVEDILKLGKEQRDKGFIYERLWDIVIKLGHCSKFPNSKFIHKIGNVDDCIGVCWFKSSLDSNHFADR